MARTLSSSQVPGTPASRRARARSSTCCIEARTSTLGISRPVIPALPDSSRNDRTRASRRAFSLRLRTAWGSSRSISRFAARRSSAYVLSCAAPARISSASAASSSDKMLVTSSMILTCTASIFPAASLAKVTGSRRATVWAYPISPAADSQVRWNAAAISSAAKSCRRGREANSPSAAIRAQASRDSIRRVPDKNPTSWSSDSLARSSPCSPVTVSSTMASSGPGAIVSARPSSANPSRDSSSAGKVTYSPCGMPSSTSPAARSPQARRARGQRSRHGSPGRLIESSFADGGRYRCCVARISEPGVARYGRAG